MAFRRVVSNRGNTVIATQAPNTNIIVKQKFLMFEIIHCCNELRIIKTQIFVYMHTYKLCLGVTNCQKINCGGN